MSLKVTAPTSRPCSTMYSSEFPISSRASCACFIGMVGGTCGAISSSSRAKASSSRKSAASTAALSTQPRMAGELLGCGPPASTTNWAAYANLSRAVTRTSLRALAEPKTSGTTGTSSRMASVTGSQPSSSALLWCVWGRRFIVALAWKIDGEIMFAVYIATIAAVPSRKSTSSLAFTSSNMTTTTEKEWQIAHVNAVAPMNENWTCT
mmetsp:Transcript_117173/g.343238  ORF Transcript_117173/g.343238 Transcript_117173/m.343238 type:complete len:208 (+) Transcript_117173:263-886(+)